MIDLLNELLNELAIKIAVHLFNQPGRYESNGLVPFYLKMMIYLIIYQ
jgi:hypothetical protein